MRTRSETLCLPPVAVTLLALTLWSSPLAGATEALEAVEHTLRFTEAQNHYVRVESRFPTDGSGDAAVELVMAVWTPGSYSVREYARHVEGLTAQDGSGAFLPVSKTQKNRWTIRTAGAGHVTVRYRLYCRVLSVQANWVDASFAMLNGAPTFLTRRDDLEQKRQRPHFVHLKLPPGWERSVTGLSRLSTTEAAGEHSYSAPSFDHLVDSPILLGNPAVYEFEVDGKPHYLAHQGEGGIWDGPRSTADVQKIVAEQFRFWGHLPYEKYTFLNVIAEGKGGLEHLNSTLMITSRWFARVPKNYRRWLGLVSHEFFHTWNVKRLRPVELGPFNYEREQPTKSLWIAEGLTSYYDDLLLWRAGLYTQKQYLEALSKGIERLQTTPGRKVHSLEMSSFDAWIKYYRSDENSTNSTISYYTKGALVGFLLDAKIRRSTAGSRSLDDVMRTAYAKYSREVGFTPGEFRALASEVAGTDVSEWLYQVLETTAELDYSEALAWYGLRFKDPKEKKKDKEDGEGEEAPKAAFLGVKTEIRGGRHFITQVRRETPAYASGFNVGDEIIAINNYRVPAEKWTERLKQYQPGERAEILVARRERLLRLTVTFDEEPPKRWNLEVNPEANEEQKKNVTAWLAGDGGDGGGGGDGDGDGDGGR